MNRYPNLKIELDRAGIKYKTLASKLNMSPYEFSSRMAGRTEFTMYEKCVIRHQIEIMSGIHFNMEYLFGDEPANYSYFDNDTYNTDDCINNDDFDD